MDNAQDLADNTNITSADNQISEPDVNSDVTGASGGQASVESTPTTDLFQGIDPKNLPPQVKPYYDSMLKDYREKTGKVSETVKSEVEKAVNSYREKADLYESIAQNEEFVRQWNEYVQKVNGSQNNGDTQNANPEIEKVQKQVQEINEKMIISELFQVTDAFADATDEKGEKLHPQFDTLNDIHIGSTENQDGSKDDFSLLRACIELAPGGSPQERLSTGYKIAKQVYDSIFEEGKKAGMGRVKSKVMNSTNPPSSLSGDVLSTTEKRPKNAREALELARRGVIVSR